MLIEGADGGSLNHLGVEVGDTGAVDVASERFDLSGMPVEVEEGTTCCYALQDKVWVTAPDGERWEYYTVLADAETVALADSGDTCCVGAA